MTNYNVHSQEELSKILSLSKDELRFSTIELHVGKYQIEHVPYDHITFVKSKTLEEPAPSVELASTVYVDCKEWTTFEGIFLIGGKLNLQKYCLIESCNLNEVNVNMGTFRSAFFDGGRLKTIDEKRYEWLGGKKLPFFQYCILRKCIIDEANIYFDWAGMNFIQSHITGDIRQIPNSPKQISNTYLSSGNILKNP